MELTAAIEALSALKRPCQVTMTTDSQYVRKGITEWLIFWKRNGWRKKDKSPILNLDLWQLLDEISSKHKIDWHWVKGHSGHPENELADHLARQAIDELLKGK